MGSRFYATVIKNNVRFGRDGQKLDNDDRGDRFAEGATLDTIMKAILPGEQGTAGAKVSINGQTYNFTQLSNMELSGDIEIEILKKSEGGSL